MGHLLKICIAVLGIVAANIVASAATYYVDFDAGNDANNGTSTGTAWKHCPGDTNATATADSTTLSAGDTVKFKGGVVYLGLIAGSWSGSAGLVITYDGNHAGDWGTGRAVLDAEYALAYCWEADPGVSYITIQGFEMRNAGGWADDDPAVTNAAAGTVTNSTPRAGGGVGFYDGGHSNLFLNNLYIHRIGGWRNTQGWEDATVDGGGIMLRNIRSATVTNCEMTKMKIAVGIYATAAGIGARDITVAGCNIHNYIVWGLDVAPQSSGAVLENISIRDNEIHDYAEFNQGNWTGVGEWPHTDGIFLRTAAIPSVWTNVRVFNNDFYCDANPGNGGTASIFVSQGASAIIYNNLFNSDSQTRIIGIEHFNPDTSEQVVRIYNNTFISGSPAISMDDEADVAERLVFLANNIYVMPAGMAANNTIITRLSGVEPEVMDYNIYYDPDWTSATKRTHVWPGPSYTFFDDVPASLGFETNGLYADPLFVDYAATPSARDLRLQSTSPAIGAGVDLSAYFTTDKNGVARGSTWDIGAFEHTSQVVPYPTSAIINGNVRVRGRVTIGP